jgi:hypothetical protein
MRRFSRVSCRNERRANLPCVTRESHGLGVPVMVSISLLLKGCRRRFGAWKAELDVPRGDLVALLCNRLSCNNRNIVALCVHAKQVYVEPLVNNGVCLRTVTL